MKCPYCGEEMIRGYLMSSRDITFAVDNLTKVFRIKKCSRHVKDIIIRISYMFVV